MKKRRKYNKKRRTIQIISRLVLLTTITIGVILGIVYFLNSDLVKADLNELTSIEFNGYDSKGTIMAKVKRLKGYEKFFDTVSVGFSKSSELSNGDKVTMQYEYDKKIAKELGLKVRAKKKTITIDGLPQAIEISLDKLFENVVVQYEGIAPQVTATIKSSNTDEALKKVTYEILDEKEFYNIGDAIIVKASFDENEMLKEGYHIESGENGYEKTYSVEEVDEYITDANELSKEQIEELKKDAVSLFGDANEFGLRIFCDAKLMPVYKNDRTTFRWLNPEFISAYFSVLSNKYSGEAGTHVNDVKIVYDAVITQDDGVSCNAEVVVRYQNLIRHTDGSIDLSLDSGSIISASGSDSNIKKLVRNTEDEKYESVKIE